MRMLTIPGFENTQTVWIEQRRRAGFFCFEKMGINEADILFRRFKQVKQSEFRAAVLHISCLEATSHSIIGTLLHIFTQQTRKIIQTTTCMVLLLVAYAGVWLSCMSNGVKWIQLIQLCKHRFNLLCKSSTETALTTFDICSVVLEYGAYAGSTDASEQLTEIRAQKSAMMWELKILVRSLLHFERW